MSDIAEIKKGDVSADVKFEAGKIVLSAKLDSAGTDAELKVSVEAGYFLDKLAAAIPGEIDDAVIALLKGALAKL